MSSENYAAILAVVLLGGVVGLAIQIAYLITLARAVEGCAPGNRTVTPGQVWLSLIPLFNIVWQFILVGRIAETLRREFSFRQTAPPETRDDYGRGVGIAMCVLLTCSWIPLLGIVCGLAGFVCWIVYWVKISGYSTTLGLAEAGGPGAIPAPAGKPAQLQEFGSLGARFLVLGVLVFGWGASYLQRSALSVVSPVWRQELGISNVQLGWTFSALAIGLLAGYVVMTVITALCGARWTLVTAFAGAALCACASGALHSVGGMIAARFLLGLFTGGLLPASVQCARDWFPPSQRPLFLGAIFAAGPVALALTPPLAVWLTQASGWRTALFVTGSPTAIAAVLCAIAWPSQPPRRSSGSVSGAAVASTAMLVLGLLFTAPISYFISGMLPAYLRELSAAYTPGITLASVMALAGSCSGALLAGTATWALMASGRDPSKARAAALTVCGCLLPLVALAGAVQNWRGAALLGALAAAGCQGLLPLLYSAVADTLPTRGVAVAAAMGALAMGIGGIASPLALGQIASNSGGFPAVFLTLAFSALAALLAVTLLAWLVRQEPA